MFHPGFCVTPFTSSFPKKDSFIHLTTSTKFCNYYSAQIFTDFNKYMYRLGRNFTIAALAKQIIVTDSFCSSPVWNQAGQTMPRCCAGWSTCKQLFWAICFTSYKSLFQKGLFYYRKYTGNRLTSTWSQVTAVSKTVIHLLTWNKKRDIWVVADSYGSST